jgi:hypothetical protein
VGPVHPSSHLVIFRRVIAESFRLNSQKKQIYYVCSATVVELKVSHNRRLNEESMSA